MTNAYNPIFRALAPYLKSIKEFSDAAGFRELLSRHQLIHYILEILCHVAPKATCDIVVFLFSGYERGSIRPEVLAVGFGHLIGGTSSKSILHYAQLLLSQRFKRFDESFQGNMKRYGLPKPPDYKVSQITSPVVLFTARNDWISSLKDVETLCSKLPNLVENYIVPLRNWSHLNHLWDDRAQQYVIPKFLEYLGRFNV
jgi:lysosomal acid lipase/cholesteryl ester hydrolase